MAVRVFNRARNAAAGFAFISAVGLSGASFAGFTAVAPPTTAGEKSHEQIFEAVYGGNFIQSGVNFNNGSVFATRIDDFLDPSREDEGRPLSLFADPNQEGGAPDVTDQIWTADAIQGTARARYANYNQDFGFVNGVTGFNYTRLLTVSGNGTGVSGTAPLRDMSNRTWRWARDGLGDFYTSKPGDNVDGLDHMVTYRVDDRQGGEGGQIATKYMLFFEDAPLFDEHDGDYNDMVVELIAYRNEVPEPASLGLLGLGVLGCSRGVVRRRRS